MVALCFEAKTSHSRSDICSNLFENQSRQEPQPLFLVIHQVISEAKVQCIFGFTKEELGSV
jgi:hypothetical protein